MATRSRPGEAPNEPAGTPSRRQFLQLGGVVALGALLPPAFATTGTASHGAPARGAAAEATGAASLYDRAFVLDANTLPSLGHQFDDAAHFQALRQSGLSALKSTLGGAPGTFEDAVGDIAAAQALIERHPEIFIKVTRHGDLERAKPEQKVAVIFSFEGASMLDHKVDRIDLFRNLGVLVMQLTYNRRTPFGCGCLDGETDGVSGLGRAAIARMNARGVALDLSHANTRTTADGIALSTAPAVFTHTGCRAVFDHPRSKHDREMKALADRGGVMGIYMLPFLTPPDRQPTLGDYTRHMVHALNVCGEDHVGIGTDSMFFTVTDRELAIIEKFEERRRKNGIGAPGENRPPYIPGINTPRKLEHVAAALLQHGYSARIVDKVLGLNFSRVFGEIWTT